MSDPLGDYIATLADDAALRPYRRHAALEALAALEREITRTQNDLARARARLREAVRALAAA